MGTLTKLNTMPRPVPPGEIVTMEGLVEPDIFVPAPPVYDWIREMFLDEEGLLFNEDHAHLEEANIGVLWTTAENSRHGRRIVGQAEMPSNAGSQGKWKRARGEQQLREWFGGQVPDFLITLDALWCADADNVAFAALVAHELRHCGQETDRFGAPKFSQSTGRPVWCIKGHDVELFVDDVRDFGIEAFGQEAVDLVLAAARQPRFGRATVDAACGTCKVKAA